MTRDDLDSDAVAEVATWPRLTAERKAELRRILLGSSTTAGGQPVDTHARAVGGQRDRTRKSA